MGAVVWCPHLLEPWRMHACARRTKGYEGGGQQVDSWKYTHAYAVSRTVLDAQGLAAFTFKLDPREFTATMGAPIGLFHRWIGLIHDRGVFSAS